MKDKRVFRATEVDSYATGWIADLSPEAYVDPDCYWKFETEELASEFIELVDAGVNPQSARYAVEIGYEGGWLWVGR